MPVNQHLDALALDRTLLSAERTFSAWIRTGLAGVGGGLAVSRALVFQSSVHQLIAAVVAGLLVIWGASLFVYAMIRYRRTCVRLAHECGAKQSPRALMVMTAMLLIVAALVFGLCVSGTGIKYGEGNGANSTTTKHNSTASIPGVDNAKAIAIANAAKAGCPISRLLKANVAMDAKLAG